MNERDKKTAAEEECAKVLEAMRKALDLCSQANEDLRKRLNQIKKEKKYPKKSVALITRRRKSKK